MSSKRFTFFIFLFYTKLKVFYMIDFGSHFILLFVGFKFKTASITHLENFKVSENLKCVNE